jgi:hypothetical protein
MHKHDRQLFALYEALVHIVIWHAHALFDEDPEVGSLLPLQEDLPRALRHTPTGPLIDSALLEALGRQLREAIAAPWADGNEEGRREALLDAVIAELSPFVRGKKRLAQPAGVILALLVDDEARSESLARRLLG